MRSDKDLLRRVTGKLRQRGYENILIIRTRVGYIVTGSRDADACVVYLVEEPDKEALDIINNVVSFLGIDKIYEVEQSLFDVSLRRVRPSYSERPEIAERCRKFMRILSSISEGQWFDHIRSREKLRGRATVELIRVIRALEELNAVEPVWRKWGTGQQHTLKIRRRLSRSELLYYLLKLLNIAQELER
ncbi:MAG: hypothetical protein GXO23_03395 [Crenarchaeota archaeon]|nr:hypothetical protein [Thermoproteota archaeon]